MLEMLPHNLAPYISCVLIAPFSSRIARAEFSCPRCFLCPAPTISDCLFIMFETSLRQLVFCALSPILVPYYYHPNDHFVQQAGSAWMCTQTLSAALSPALRPAGLFTLLRWCWAVAGSMLGSSSESTPLKISFRWSSNLHGKF